MQFDSVDALGSSGIKFKLLLTGAVVGVFGSCVVSSFLFAIESNGNRSSPRTWPSLGERRARLAHCGERFDGAFEFAQKIDVCVYLTHYLQFRT